MSQKKIPLSEATGPQMREFAQTHLGMEFRHNEANEKVRAAIKEAWGKDEILIEEPAEHQPQAGANPPAPPGKEPPTDKVRLIIQRTDEPGGDDAVPVGVNGKVMLIPRGEEVDVPLPYFEVLKHAERFVYESYKEGGMNPVPRRVPAYPFQRIA